MTRTSFHLDREYHLKTATQVVDVLSEDGKGVLGQIAVYRLNGRISAKGFGGNRQKPDWYYSFRDEARLEAYVETYSQQLRSNAAYKVQRAADVKARRVNHFQVGDLLAYSWGYEQTNVDFCQVVEVGKSTVKLREIEGAMVPGSETGPMSCYVRPVKDAFIEGKPVITKLAQFYSDPNDRYVRMEHGSAQLTREGSKHYCSWYA